MEKELMDNFEFMTSREISKSLAKKIKAIRKKKFKTQELFAKHIGMSFSAYSRFEKSGQISFQGFIDVIKGIDRVDEIARLFKQDKDVITW